MLYLKLIMSFILKTLFNKDEYNIHSKNFNPIRFFTIMLLVLNAFFTVYILYKLNNVHDIVYKKCPDIFEEIKN